MLEASDTQTIDTLPAAAAMQAMRDLIERLQGEIKFDKTTIAALNFEIARLKRWRFGQSSESLDTQVALFDQIVADTQAEDTAAQHEQQTPAADLTPKSAPRRAVRQALPSGLPRIEHHHELPDTVCECGQVLQRVGLNPPRRASL